MAYSLRVQSGKATVRIEKLPFKFFRLIRSPRPSWVWILICWIYGNQEKNNWLRLKLQRGNSWDRKVRKLSIHQHRCIFSILNLSSNCYANPLSICTWFLQFSSLKYPVWWTWFLVYFKLQYRLQQEEKSSADRWEVSSTYTLESRDDTYATWEYYMRICSRPNM